MKTIKYILLLSLIILLTNSCSKDFLEVSDPNNIDRAVFWISEENAVKSVNAIYSSLKENEFLGLDYFYFAPFCSGEYDKPYNQQARLDFMNFSVKADNKINWLMWKDIFRCIMRSNDAIANIPGMPDDVLSTDKKNQLLGQAYFLRGLNELYGLQMYGKYYPSKDTSALGIPIVLRVPPSRDDMFIKRETVGASYRQIISDFTKARDLLPATWDAENLGRATKGAAIAYAAKTHVWLNQYQKAISDFDELFGMKEYALIDKFENNLNGEQENNSESIFELQYADFTTLNPWVGGPAQSLALEFAPIELGRGNARISMETSDYFALYYNITQTYIDKTKLEKIALPADMLTYITGLVGQTVAPSEFKSNLITSFGQDSYFANINTIYKWIEGKWDPRWETTAFQRGDTFKINTNSIVYFYKTQLYTPQKYTDNDRHAINTGGTLGANSDNIQLYRLSYAYLLYAEAQNESGNTEIAIDYINKVRTRAYRNNPELLVELVPGLTQEQIRAEIDIENLREICGETLRWHDMIRWGLAEKYCTRRGFIKGVHEALPIPQEEMELNPNIIQNFGY
jgi:starch-binding outer membrane protein, SusD/RagB family